MSGQHAHTTDQPSVAIKGLQESVASRRVRVVTHHPHYLEKFLKIREAMARRIRPEYLVEVEAIVRIPG